MDLEETNKMWQHPWLLAHRVHLHDKLKKVALDPEGKGKPAQLSLASRVTDVDSKNATITLANGEVVQGDLVLGADGVKSVTRSRVVGREVAPFSSGKSAFRFLITRKAAQEDPLCANLVQKMGELVIWYSSDRRIVCYPTTNNELLNFVCIHPDAESNSDSETWGAEQKGHFENMLKVYEGWDKAVLALLEKADVDSLKVWKLLDMEVLDTWVSMLTPSSLKSFSILKKLLIESYR